MKPRIGRRLFKQTRIINSIPMYASKLGSPVFGLLFLGAMLIGGCTVDHKPRPSEFIDLPTEKLSSKPILVTMRGFEQLRSRSYYTSLTCSAFSFDYKFDESAKETLHQLFSLGFNVTKTPLDSYELFLEFEDAGGDLNCNRKFGGVNCKGNYFIIADVRLSKQGLNTVNDEIVVGSTPSDGTLSPFCTAAGNEMEKNFKSAMKKFLDELREKTLTFMGTEAN